MPIDWIMGWLSRVLPRRVTWELYYRLGRTPWDMEEVPPELQELLGDGRISPARALDIGCGTGSYAIYMAMHCPRVVGVDFSRPAVNRARRKAARAGSPAEFAAADVLDLGLPDDPVLGESVDFALDVSCMHTFEEADRARYAAMVTRVVRPGGWYLLYAWAPREVDGEVWGFTPEEVAEIIGDGFRLEWVREVKGRRRPRFCYLFQRVDSADGRTATG